MAPPILLDLPPRDPRAELQSRLQNAPAEHAEALLSALDLLQALHDGGAIDVMRGAVGSSHEILEILVEAGNSPASIRGIRSLIVMFNMIGEIDPDALATCTRTIPPALKLMAQQPEPPGLWKLMRDFLWDRDARRGLAALNTLLRTFGKSLAGNKGQG
jgi:uncharacterized protein YjgD (DUF1641 family)